MAQFIARVTGISMTASTAKTLLQIVPASGRPVTIKEVSFSFTDTTTTDNPVKCELVRQSTAGTSSSLTVLANSEADTTAAAATALQTFTAEPTLVSAPLGWEVSPVGGTFVLTFPLGEEPDAITNRVALRVTPGSAISGTVDAYIRYKE